MNGESESGQPIAPEPTPEPQGNGASPDARRVDQDVRRFCEELQAKYADRVEHRPRAFKKRVLALVQRYLPPHPKPTGRPMLPRVTIATGMYLEMRSAGKVNWYKIAMVSVAGFERMLRWRRRTELATLRSAVYARRRRRRRQG